MILDHIFECSCLIIKSAPFFYTYRLRSSDLHMVYVIPVPYRFKKDVCKPENEHVLHRLFTQIMLDSVETLLPTNLGGEEVEVVCDFLIIAEGFLPSEPRYFAAARGDG